MVRVILLTVLTTLTLSFAAAAQTRVVFETPGASADLRDELAAASLVLQARNEGTTASQPLLAAAQADYERLLGVLYANARYGGIITIRIDGREAAAIPGFSAPKTIREIRIRIQPGPLYRFGTAFAGPLAAGTVLPEGFRRTAPARTGTIAVAAEQSISAWRDQGHAKARIADQQITARHGANQLDARLRLDPGPRLTFGDISVAGNEDVRTARVLKIAGLEEGRTFDPKEIEQAERRLRRTGSFSSVSVAEAETIGPDNTLPLSIGVVEQTPRRFGFGAEYSTVEGATLSAFWLHRNFLGGAERFRVDGDISGLGGETGGTDYQFGARYERPATPKADTDFFAEFQVEMLDEPDFTSDTGEFTLGFTRYAAEDLTVEGGIGYLYSETTDAFGPETFELLTLPLGAVLDRRDNALNPTEGYFLDLTTTPFAGLSGTSDGAQLEFDARAYRTAGNLTFAGRMQLGALFGPSLVESPAFYRFYSGGGGSVRGQDYQSLGVEQGGLTTGGRSLLALSGELRAGISDNIQLVAFADWGYVGSESFPDFTGDSHAGAGLGVRYNTGIGPIRLDLATPVSGDTSASDFYVYIGIGQAF
ncbi:MAG: outer membrane protein assembly factor [Silicimonas sp.]|nr:outer membrane protein assembly factor [Silicimonas sp.]